MFQLSLGTDFTETMAIFPVGVPKIPGVLKHSLKQNLYVETLF